MRIFLICLLAGTAYGSVIVPVKRNNKHLKRELGLTYSSNVYNGQQLPGGVDPGQSVQQQAAYSDLGSGITSGLTYTASGSLPANYQPYSNGVYDSLSPQSASQQFAQDSLVAGVSQSVNQDSQGFGSFGPSGQPLANGVISRTVEAPISSPYSAQLTRLVQVSAPHLELTSPVQVSQDSSVYAVNDYPTDLPRNLPYGVPHQIPVTISPPGSVDVSEQAVQINSGYQADVGQSVLIGGSSYRQQTNAAQQDTSFQNLGSAVESSLGIQQLPLQYEADYQNAFSRTYEASHQNENLRSNGASTKTDNQDEGYRYDPPTKKFTF